MSAIEYSHEHEAAEKSDVEKEWDNKVQKCGLFIHPEHFYLGAIPDGLIGDDGLLKIKCPVSVKI